jgi:outer membrane receptor protein involved in Fe transport
VADGLRTIASVSGRSIAAPAGTLAGKIAPALDGDYTVETAVALLLDESGLYARPIGSGFVIEATSRGRGEAAPKTAEGDIVVTGSRISGVKSSSPVVEVRREAMKSAGRTTVDDVIRAIPQNFGGGQNPGVGTNVPERSGTNVGGSSSINLRGLGSDATLTLLDGQRLPYSAALQSVDVSAIPFGAIDRIEIVPDGASTIYGSDAVAGVANVILRHDFTGLETSAKLGGSTDGGYFIQQYGLTAGAKWATGGAMLTFEHDGNTSIMSNQRDYLARVRPGVTTYPALRQNNAALVASQRLAPNLTFSLDALVGQRVTDRHFPLNAAGDLAVSASYLLFSSQSLSLAPSLDWTLGKWAISLAATYGANKTDYSGLTRTGLVTVSSGAGYYRNRGSSIELSADGPLFALPGGAAKGAIGVGARRSDFFRSTGSAITDIAHIQDSSYAFGELNLPVMPILTATAAIRYERYPGVGSVVTPKFGGILSPTPDIDLKGSWGRSYRAPTLYQEYSPAMGYLIPARSFGGPTATTATALYASGGNADLKPERSTNWSATADIHPRSMPEFDFSISYFSVDYRDRIVTPILFTAQALSNPSYAAYVTRAPSFAQQNEFIAGSATFTNAAGTPYVPANVVAIVRNTSVNAGRQQARGVDALLAYATNAGPGKFHASLNMSYIDSSQQLSAGQPVTQLAGILFNPPHLKGRGELGYAIGPVTITGDVNYIGPVRDTRTSIPVRIAGMTPVDFTLRYKSPNGGALRGLDVVLSAQNLFDERPSLIASTVLYDTPFDTTNYSALGRVISLSVSKTW